MQEEGRDDARFFLPRTFNIDNYPNVKWCPLSKLAVVPKRSITPNKSSTREKEFNFINVADIDEKEGTLKEVHAAKGGQIKGTKSLAKAGELVFARIEPSIYNKKSAIIPANVTDLVCSTELTIISPKKGVDSTFLLWVLRSDWLTSQVTENLMRGSTGRRRLGHRDLLRLSVPDVSTHVQREIAEMVSIAHHERERKLVEAVDVLKQLDRNVKELVHKASHEIMSG
jgi:hypothetical protein